MSIDQLFTEEHLPGGVRITPAATIPKEIFVNTFGKNATSSERDSVAEIAETRAMSDQTDYRHELQLRDDQLRREMDQRQEFFRAEQAVRDKALDDRFSGFLAAQAERDKAWEKISEARFDRIEKDIGSIKTDTKKVSDDISGIKLTMAKYLGAAIVVGAVASAMLGAAAKHLIG